MAKLLEAHVWQCLVYYSVNSLTTFDYV
jgi:hypothetical protein